MTGTNVDPRLAPLDTYGPGVRTMALLPGSAAINIVSAAHCLATDARTVARPQGAECDSGAFERIPLSLTGALPVIGTAHLDWNDTIHDGYALWRGSEPYTGYSFLSNRAVSEADVPVDPSQDDFYEVYSKLNPTRAEVSNRIGVYAFALVPGAP